ncbi:consortin isoform X2 [Mugil cephalus]|nr:consortin isoform X2 [Mugil cephalus]
MDHGGQFETEGRGMSQVCVGGDDLCDNLPNPEALAGQTRNLNEANAHSVPPSPNEEGGTCGLQKTSLNNNGKEKEVGQGKEGQAGRSQEEEDEEDVDEVMRDEEEEEESEESSCLTRGQSPETPMTDSSYSETGSLLETPYPLSPGTSPEPTSPVIPVVSPETLLPIGSVEPGQSDAEMDSHISSSGSGASTTGSVTSTQGPTITTWPSDPTLQTITSDTGPPGPAGPTCIMGAADRIAKNIISSAEQLTSSTEPSFICGPTNVGGSTCSYLGSTTSTTLTSSNTSVASNTMSATTELLTSATGPTTTGTESSSTTGPISSYTPVTTCSSVPTSATGPILNTALLESLGQLAQRGDDTHLPQYLHQVAEAFVLHEDYQRALWCIQLERLYHQRVLDNLNALQQQWEGQCRRTSSELTTQHLDTLKHICQTHTRPRTRDAECASLDFLKTKFEESGALASCTSVHQAEGGMEHRAEDSSCPSINLPDRLNSLEVQDKDREGPDRFAGSQLSDKPGSDREGGQAEGGVGHAISIIGNGLHPSTAGGMDQSTSAEQQGEDLGPAQEKEVKTEDGEAAEEMEAEGDDEEEEEAEEEEGEQEERDSPFCQKAPPVETIVSGTELEGQQLHSDAVAQEELHVETQQNLKIQEAHPPQETHMKHQEEGVEEEEEEEEEGEEEYEVNQANIIREAPTLDDMAKLITVEEISPASGLVSILKKRSICMDTVSISASSEPRPQKAPAKRRVRFKVPDDGYEQDVGGGDSCLLLFLLCLVTVVISVGGTALYCALGDAQSSVCQDFSRNADFYMGQIQRGVTQIQHWLTAWS